MKPEIAERLAAVAPEEGVTVDQAHAIIREFLDRLRSCPSCDDSGQFVYGRESHVQARVPNGGHGQTKDVIVEAGTPGPCPRCGGANGDPDWVAWHCFSDDYTRDCRNKQEQGEGGATHASCGFHLVLPLDILEDA